MQSYLDFEKPVADLEGKIAELKSLAATDQAVSIDEEVNRLSSRADEALVEIYKKLTPWQKTQVARHPQRPHFSDYIKTLITEWQPMAGDRKFAEDSAIQAGFGRFNGQPVAVLGQEKGNSTESRLKHNFGMARPEGYRKAVRIMEMADRFNIPVISFVDTAGAYPGIGAEERGQAEAIARSTEKSLELGVPNIAIVIGEGGSGGAIAIATASRVLMLEHAIYSVISPEGGATILWRDAARAQDAATNMKITSADLLGFGVIDGIIPEPTGGAHRHPEAVMASTREALAKFLADFSGKSRLEVREHRREKFMAIGTAL
ncbi:acetyl-CoA carboxylase carboxyltransferase subunit alpha [Devosia sp. J2-20]|jgi:acetyl-CoA carboxylase carboxyl transferase subunit alpha|uniref:Acetyl-coenzyme A carboxylase carboxyl transferase subunit alpha n=1 Tax=Devosia litorisediminis TaxID=2829817 RepID=A0A942IF20_9HYPH|nr:MULTISPECIES: acetyl-CoA carboxylase carboxyltransferase subunit alpha [Devosia]MBS3850045.1 acetyl-CoA carboxylase carboxyltransferase subunit alpha [Devosia litorisediminis]MCZ4347532.1 acetyl-CoA carboxylase carboxyltransferase subunit alpha [Devosia neptuniae]WDQ99823.1 acetyl-CoA carboxylase carboxyltransferase subunit alpha [Devosia sp. J2-20]|tara:strand:+ start:31411 stop:32364 length:954 start_codon:yes stop_codon:yes gene_type:complete